MSWAGTFWLREQDETSPLPVFHSCISSRCAVRPLTCALGTGLWNGSYIFLFVPHFIPTQTTEFYHFCTFFPKFFQSMTPTFFPIAVLSNPSYYLFQLSSTDLPLSLSTFSPFPNLVYICYSGLKDVLTSSLTPSLLFCH